MKETELLPLSLFFHHLKAFSLSLYFSNYIYSKTLGSRTLLGRLLGLFGTRS